MTSDKCLQTLNLRISFDWKVNLRAALPITYAPSKKLKIKLPLHPAIPLLGINAKVLKEEAQTVTRTQVIATLVFILNSNPVKQPKCP